MRRGLYAIQISRGIRAVVARLDDPEQHGETWDVLGAKGEFAEWSEAGTANRILFAESPCIRRGK